MPYKNIEDQRACGRRGYWRNRPQRLEWKRKYQRKVKQEILAAYGGTCQCCGESEIAFLSIDHINGGGNKHRAEIGGGSKMLYVWLKANNFPTGFQTLCMNCQFGKSYYGVCPHKVGGSSPR